MSIDQIVSVTITATSPGVTQEGFGIPLILGTPSWATDRVRFYTDLSGVAVDFASTRPEYKAAAAMFAQSPRPVTIGIARLANKPVPSWDILPIVADSTVYTVYVNGTAATFTSGTSTTAALICAGLASAITTLAVSGLTATDNTTKVTLAGAAGTWFSVKVADINLLSNAMVHADPGVNADLDAILIADSTWYAIVNPWNSALMATVIAAWAESNKRLFLLDTQESACATHVLSGATDIMAAQQTLAHKYTAVIYHPDNSSFIAAAWAAALLPLDPGSETWALKQLSGPAAVGLTTTHRANILAKYGNCYERIAGVNVTEMGTVADGEYIDVIRLIDWTSARIKETVYADLVANPKIPFTDAGIAQIAGDVKSVLSTGVNFGGFVSYTVTVPKAADLLTADKAARILKGIHFSAVLAGAAHTAQIQGTVSV